MNENETAIRKIDKMLTALGAVEHIINELSMTSGLSVLFTAIDYLCEKYELDKKEVREFWLKSSQEIDEEMREKEEK